MTATRRPSNQHRPKVDREGPIGLRFGMFATCVVRDGSKDISGKPKELYILLVTFADTEGRDTDMGYPYRSVLAKALGCGTKTVDRSTAVLEDIGLATVHRRKLPGSSENDANRYELHDGWLIHGVEPSRRVPRQLVERYGSQIKGFDAAAFLEGGRDTDDATPRDMGDATGRDMGVPQSRTGSREPSSTDGKTPSDGRQATSGSRGQSKGGKAASKKKSPFLTPQEGKLVAAALRAMPEDLQSLLPEKKPSQLKRAVLQALSVDKPDERTPEQLATYRVAPKWFKHYRALHAAGELEKPVGAFMAMLRRDKECGNDRCDERTDVDTDEACRACEVGKADRAAERRREKAAQEAQQAPVEAPEPPESDPCPTEAQEAVWDAEVDYYPDLPAAGEGEAPGWATPAEPSIPEQPHDSDWQYGGDALAAARQAVRTNKSAVRF